MPIPCEAVLKALPEPLLVADASGRVLGLNKRAEMLFGYPRGALTGRPLQILLLEEQRAAFALWWRQAQEGQEAQAAWTAQGSGGAAFPIELRLGRDAGPDLTVVAVRDQTVQREEEARCEALLRRQRGEFEAMVRAVTDYAICVMNADGEVVSWNEGARRLTYYTAEQVVGRHVSMFYTPEERAAGVPAQALAEAREQGRSSRVGWRVRRDGTLMWVETVYTPYTDEGRLLGYVAVVRDMTEPMRLERFKDQLLSIISHELRTPLNFITGNASILEEEIAGPLNAAQRACLSGIELGSIRLDFIINNLLEASEIFHGTLHASPSFTRYEAVVGEALFRARAGAAAKPVGLVCDLDVPGEVLLDGRLIVHVLENLLDNAIKFSPEHGQVVLRAGVRDGWLVTEVDDEGPGLSPERVQAAFERFVQGDMSYTRVFGGLGLGLANARAVAEQHGGSIALLPRAGGGTTARLSLPLAPEEA